jgi:PIN domain nuclease of toxin-antitoxin system
LSRLLVDTNVVIWWLAEDPHLPAEMSERLSSGGDSIVISPVVAWEIEIKRALGKLQCPDDLEDQVAANAFAVLPVSLHHATVAGRLPLHHKDPFDRLLIAQAQCERLTLVTSDERLTAYDIDVLVARA